MSLRDLPATIPEFHRWPRMHTFTPTTTQTGRVALASLFTVLLGASDGMLDLQGAETLLAKEIPLSRFPDIASQVPWAGPKVQIYRDGVDDAGLGRFVVSIVEPSAEKSGKTLVVRLYAENGGYAEAELTPQWPALCAEPRVAANLSELEVELALRETT